VRNMGSVIRICGARGRYFGYGKVEMLLVSVALRILRACELNMVGIVIAEVVRFRTMLCRI